MHNNIPEHIAIIMDGNGRWAEKKLLGRINGHKKGIDAARDIVAAASDLGVGFLTLYTFSKENWNRPALEVDMLMRFLEKHIRAEASNMMKSNIRFVPIGNIDELPKKVVAVVRDVEKETSGNDGMVLQLALSYGGRAEITEAAKQLALKVQRGELTPDDISEESFAEALYTRGIPDPDLLIRTSGEMRVSNFLLWQMAYTELYVTETLWPDFTRADLELAIRDYQRRERRFGLTGNQLMNVAG